MAVLCNTSLTGVQSERVRVGSPISAADMKEIAEDQALIYERLTGLNADGGGGASTNTIHNHTDEHSRMFLPLMTQAFGDEAIEQHTLDDPSDTITGQPCTLYYTDTSTAHNRKILWYFPIYVPNVGGETPWLRCVVNCSGGNPGLDATLQKTFGTDIAGSSRVPFSKHSVADDLVPADRDDDVWYADLHPEESGLHYVKILFNAVAGAWTKVMHELSVYSLVGNSETTVIRFTEAPTPTTGTNAQVGDPDNSNAWHPVDASLCTDKAPLGPSLLLSTHNDGLLQELALGIPHAGNAALTLAKGHDHSGTSGYGAEIRLPVGSWAFGRYQSEASAIGYGNGYQFPLVTTDAWHTVAHFWVQTPDSATADAATSRMRFAAVAYYEGTAKAGKGSIRVTTNGDTVNARTYSFGTSGASDSYCAVTGTDKLETASGGYTQVKIELDNTADSDDIGIAGICLYLGDP